MQKSNYFMNMSDEKLKEELLLINGELLQSTKVYNIKNAMLWLHRIESLVKEENMGISELQTYMLEEVDEMRTLIFMEKAEEKKLYSALGIRRELYDSYQLMKAYDLFAVDLLEILDYYGLKAYAADGFQEKTSPEVALQRLKTQITYVLKELQHMPEKYFQTVRDVVHELPMNVTKEKAFDILGDSLCRILNGRVEAYVEFELDKFREMSSYRHYEGFGRRFQSVYDAVSEIRQTNIAEKSSDELKHLMSIVRRLIEGLRFYLARCKELGICINQLITCYQIRDEEASHEIEVFFEKYNNYRDRENYYERLEKSLAEDVKFQNNKVASFNEANLAILGRENFDMGKLVPVLEKSREMLLYYNDLGFASEAALKRDMLYPLERRQIEDRVKELLAQISKEAETFPPLEKKIMLRRMISTLSVPFINMDDFIKYVENSLSDPSMSSHMKLSKMALVEYILKQSVNSET